MEYLLREWYESFHKGRIGRYMELEEAARSFSEEYFQGLYKRKLEAWLDWLAKNAMEEHWEDGSYSDSKRRAAFASNFQAKLGTLERLLPAELRAEIADLRVLALDHTTQEVIDEITAYCKANRAAVETASNAYDREFIRNFAQGLPDSFKGFGWHDDTVLSIRKECQKWMYSKNWASANTSTYMIPTLSTAEAAWRRIRLRR